MHNPPELAGDPAEAINRGFSKQSSSYDELDDANRVLKDLRTQVYLHVDRFIKPASRVLELNAGTGIDARHFASRGHRVHATDLSDGMIAEIQKKAQADALQGRLTCQQLSFTDLDQLSERHFDYVFSNFGGLNCIRDLRPVTSHLADLLNFGAYVTFVVMPPLALWECALAFKGRWNQAFRRLHANGTAAVVEGETFQTYYHSCDNIIKSFPPDFRFVASEGLAVIAPPPHRHDLPAKFPRFYRTLRRIDGAIKNTYPFNTFGDHIIVTLRYLPTVTPAQ